MFLFLLTVALRARAVSYLLTDGSYAMLLISCCDDTSPVSKAGIGEGTASAAAAADALVWRFHYSFFQPLKYSLPSILLS